MKTVTASDANRQFSKILRDVGRGDVVTVTSRGKPLAKIVPFQADSRPRKAAQKRLVERLRGQAASGVRGWRRDDLYEDAQ